MSTNPSPNPNQDPPEARPGRPLRDALRDAARVFFALVERGDLSRTRDAHLCRLLEDPDVRSLLGILEEESDLQVLETSTGVFLCPGLGNEVFGYTTAELRQRLRVETNDKLALCGFALLSLLSLFYRGQGLDTKSRDFVEIEEWRSFLARKLEGIRDGADQAAGDTAGDEAADPLRLNMPGVLKAWAEMVPFDETKTRQLRATNNQIALLTRVFRFLEEENLVKVEQERIIHPTSRLDAIMQAAYSDEARRASLAAFFAADTDGAAGNPGESPCPS